MIAAAQLTLLDIEGSVKEMERAVKDGCRGAFVTLGGLTQKPHAHPDHDPLFAKAQELDLPLAIQVAVDLAQSHCLTDECYPACLSEMLPCLVLTHSAFNL
jgi:predicted TIM-barrel fold metal-dependent hydrolase